MGGADRRGLLFCLAALLVGGLASCPDRPSDPRRRGTSPSAPSPEEHALGPRLSGLLERLPVGARWAVVTADLGPAANRTDELFGLLGEHPALETSLKAAKTRLERQLGLWPFDLAGRRALGLTDESAIAIFGLPRPPGAAGPSPLGLVVSGVRTQALAQAISGALRQRGHTEEARVVTRRVGGRLLLTFQERWTCAYEQGATSCVEAPAERWAELAHARKRNLRSGPLGTLSDAELSGDLGLYWAGEPARWSPVASLLLGLRPLGLWGALSLGKKPRLRAILLGKPTPTAPRSPSQGARPPVADRASGLAAARGAEATLRLRLGAKELLSLLGAMGEVGSAMADLIGPVSPEGPPSLGRALSGELLLLSFPEGLGAMLGLGDLASAERGLAALTVKLSARLPTWQRKIREQGPGWNLAAERLPGAGLEAQGLLLQLPTGKGAPLPTLPGGQLHLVWGISGRHLVAATDLHLFRRLQAQATQNDALFLDAPQSADRRRAFASDARLSLALQADDPLILLPAPQRDTLLGHLDDLGPFTRRLLLGLRMAGDLLHEITLSVRAHPAGVAVEICLGLPLGPAREARGERGETTAPAVSSPLLASRPLIDPAYREALRRKWGGNLAGHTEALTTLSRQETPSWSRDKARRNLPPPEAIPHAGALGLTASALLPLSTARLHRLWMNKARERLGQLGEQLHALSIAAASLPPRARVRWHRTLQSAALTPARRCCDARDHRCHSEPSDWWHPLWKSLGFKILGPHRFRYGALVERGSIRTRIVFRAEGDLDCDGRFTLLELPAQVDETTGHLTLDKLRLLRSESKPAP